MKNYQPRTFLIAIANESLGDQKRIYECVKHHQRPSDEALEKAVGVDAITAIDKEYPTTLSNGSRMMPIVLYVVKREKGCPTEGYPNAAVQSEGRIPWPTELREQYQRVIGKLTSEGKSYCYAKEGLIHWVAPNGAELVLSLVPDGCKRTTPANIIATNIVTFSMAIDAYFFHIGNHSGTAISVATFLNANHGDCYVTPRLGDNETFNNEIIEMGATPLVI